MIILVVLIVEISNIVMGNVVKKFGIVASSFTAPCVLTGPV